TRAGTPGAGATGRAAREAAPARRRQPVQGSRVAGKATAGARTRPRARWRAGGGARRVSGAVSAEHARLVLELAAVLHQVALLAYELGGLGRHHLHRQRLQALLSCQTEDRVLVLLVVPPFLLDDEVLDRLDVVRVAGRGGRRLLHIEVLGLLLVELLVVDLVFDVFHGRSLTPAGGLYCRGATRTGSSGYQTRERGPLFPVPFDPPSAGAQEGSGAPGARERDAKRRGPKRPLGPRRRGAAFSTQPLGSSDAAAKAVTRGYCRAGLEAVSNVLVRRAGQLAQAANTSRPRETVRIGRSPSSDWACIGSRSNAAKSAWLPGSSAPFLSSRCASLALPIV